MDTMVIRFMYVVAFFWSLLVLRGYPFHHDPGAGSWVSLFVMSLVWVADTGAYFTGRAFGSRKLLPAVSPNKTIEGLLGLAGWGLQPCWR